MSIDGSIFNDPAIPSVEITVDSAIQCASVARNMNWPNVMHFSNRICRLADADMTSCHNAIIEGSATVLQGKWLHESMFFY